MYTFGAPRVGNSAFAEAFNSRLGNRSWRITNASDIVPTVPRLMGYSHGACVRLRVMCAVAAGVPGKVGGGCGPGKHARPVCSSRIPSSVP